MQCSRSEPAMVDGRARKSVPQRARRIETPILRARTRLRPCLGARRWRVFEDTRADKGRGNPDRVQRRDETKLKGWSRRCNKRRGCRLVDLAGTDQSDGAFMLSRLCLGVHQLVQPRRDAEGKRQKKRGADTARDGAAYERAC